ncbi:hypothetical protein [Litoreibacter janthinus]|uniref:Uncharacterized protein n=1 Tax=Litoreibacter janthinus TaxID=670154 RepID=A0A1I6GAB5_9RHOB|nr:hypothetical protein [Litoreibacter janthinus]SFR39118.1 hypothetical protein SAMN04488002_1140 [Litoreibacter janthinus]
MTSSFIYLEGILTEANQFELGRNLETRMVDPAFRDQGAQHFGDQMAELTLSTAKGRPLVTSTCAVNIPAGCSSTTPFAGIGLIRAAIAHHPNARLISLRHKGAKLFQGAVARNRPIARVKAFRADTKTASFDLERPSLSQATIWADLSDGKRVRAPAVLTKAGRWQVDLLPLAGVEHATLIAEVTHRFRTAEVSCGQVKLAKAVVNGLIIEPANGAAIPLGRRISLVGNLFDQNGREIDWVTGNYAWRMNGKVLDDCDCRMVAWSTDKPGEHRLELVANSKAKGVRVLAAANFQVNKMTEGQAELFELLKARTAPAAGFTSER